MGDPINLGIEINGHVAAGAERGRPGPAACFIRRKTRAPNVTAAAAIAVAIEEAGHNILLRARSRKRDLQAIVEEGVRCVVGFAGRRPVKTDLQRLPFHEVSLQHGSLQGETCNQ